MLLIASIYLDSMHTVNLYLKDDGTLAVNDSAKCELLNQYFASFTMDSGILLVFLLMCKAELH